MESLRPENARDGSPVPCPRCQSSNTKFCYYNNHNVNQPRHFCRDCQRYWTAGGSLRNVPIGAGKRKHKGPLGAPAKPESLPNVFSFHPDQGLYAPCFEHHNVLSFKQHVAHSCGESKPVLMPCAAPQLPAVSEVKPQIAPAVVSLPQVSASYDAANAVLQASAFVSLGLTELRKQPSLSLGLNLSKEAKLQECDPKTVSHTNNKNPLDPPAFSQQNTCKQDSYTPAQYANTEREESPGCSSVTANLGTSVLEAVEVSTNPTTNAPTVPTVEQIPNLQNPMLALGAAMCPPWLWPFMLSGHNPAPPASLPQVDPTLAAATVGAMASMPPINPAFAAAMGAMASTGRLPQIDPNVMAAVTASFLQFPPIWSPYAWAFPWNTPWNMASAVVNEPNGVNKRPASPSLEQRGESNPAKKVHLQEASHTTGMRVAESMNAPNFSSPPGYFDAFQLRQDAFPLKPAVPLPSDERMDTHQQQASPHSNPAAQARSAAFQEGN